MFGQDSSKSVCRVLEAVDGFGDNSKTLNVLFMNLLRVSYIDPTLDRCAAAHEFLSGADIFLSDKISLNNHMEQYSMQRLHIPSAAAAVHLLCRVELRPDLVFSTRELSDARYQREANFGLVQKFAEGLPPKIRMGREIESLSMETIPFSLWILSAGESNSSLNRAASSIEILTKPEKASFDAHVTALASLGLTYVADHDGQQEETDKNWAFVTPVKLRLEPPIERLVQYAHFRPPPRHQRKEIPSVVSMFEHVPIFTVDCELSNLQVISFHYDLLEDERVALTSSKND